MPYWVEQDLHDRAWMYAPPPPVTTTHEEDVKAALALAETIRASKSNAPKGSEIKASHQLQDPSPPSAPRSKSPSPIRPEDLELERKSPIGSHIMLDNLKKRKRLQEHEGAKAHRVMLELGNPEAIVREARNATR